MELPTCGRRTTRPSMGPKMTQGQVDSILQELRLIFRNGSKGEVRICSHLRSPIPYPNSEEAAMTS